MVMMPTGSLRAGFKGRSFQENGCTISQDLGDTGRDLVGVIPHGDHRVCTLGACVSYHQIVRLLAGALGELRIERDVAAEKGLELRPNGSEHVA
jgi:hypothetical protein